MNTIILNKWKLRNREKSINIDIKPPETVFEALISNDIIKDPFYGLNEKEVSWVYESNWIYESEFSLGERFMKYSNLILQFNGLDTLADIYLNDMLLDSVNNMFKKYEYQIKPLLNNDLNRIKVIFKSPTREAKRLIERFGVKLNTGEKERAMPGVPYLRKAQYCFGWDWGPILPDIGLWKNVKILGFDIIRIKSIFPIQDITFKEADMINRGHYSQIFAESVSIKCQVEIDSEIKALKNLTYKLRMEIISKEGEIYKKEKRIQSKKQMIELTILEPNLWWTHDLGEPYLYDLTISIIGNELRDKVSQKLGIREIKLIKRPDKWGKTFYFLLNKIPFFAKGANWIPIDSFIPRGKKHGLYERNLTDAKLANMNMIRVWGGGIYEDEVFYKICDKLGILVWQDFPFACAIYPYHENFFDNIKGEFIQNIKRLRKHPSLAIWCGNNEIEYLWRLLKVNSGITEEKTELQYKRGYIKVFEDMLPNLLKKLDPARPYWPSSPSNGFCGIDIGSVHSNSPNEGDSHYWSVWHGKKPFTAYRRFHSRFMSEFGFESFPLLKTIESFCPKEQYDIFSPVMESHQKNDAGNKKILDYMKKRFSIPKSFEKKIILSQITQAEALEYGVEHWRKKRTHFRCMGVLYWQLNDCWPVASWSSVDYYGRWKALHYFAKRFYKPLFPYIEEKKKQIKVGVVNDTLKPENLTFIWKIYNSKGMLLMEGKEKAEIKGLESKLLTTIHVSEINKTKKLRRNNILFYKLIKASTNEIIYRGSRLFEKPKEFELKKPELTYDINLLESTNELPMNLKMEIKSKHICLYTFIFSELVDFIASNNFFSLEPYEKREIFIEIKRSKNKKEYPIDDLLESFRVYSLYDLIYS